MNRNSKQKEGRPDIADFNFRLMTESNTDPYIDLENENLQTHRGVDYHFDQYSH